MISIGLVLISCVILCFFDAQTEYALPYALVLLLAKGGCTLSFGFTYAIHLDLFPSHFIITSYGVCNFFCRGLTMFAPMVAEFENQ